MSTTRAADERERLTALGGLAALSLDALSSVACGPEAIRAALVAAGAAALKYTLPITGAIVVLLAVLVISYRQVIEAFPSGGGAYAVSGRYLGVLPSLIAAASLIVDYVLLARDNFLPHVFALRVDRGVFRYGIGCRRLPAPATKGATGK